MDYWKMWNDLHEFLQGESECNDGITVYEILDKMGELTDDALKAYYGG
jgi:hypothetical protein